MNGDAKIKNIMEHLDEVVKDFTKIMTEQDSPRFDHRLASRCILGTLHRELPKKYNRFNRYVFTANLTTREEYLDFCMLFGGDAIEPELTKSWKDCINKVDKYVKENYA